MNIIIVGGGKIGTTILQNLVQEGHDVVAVDSDPGVIAEISNLYDVMCVCGNGVDWETLTEAGVENAQLLIAVTGSDEFNMLCCFMAKRLGVKNTIARIRNPEYNDKSLGFIKQTLDLSFTINPDKLAAKELFHLLQMPGAESVETFSRKSFEIVELVLKENSVLIGKSLMEMKKKYPASYLVGTVQRNGEAFIPGGSFVLESGDRIGLTADAEEMQRLLQMLGLEMARARAVMIIGAGRATFYLAKLLLDSGCRVTVVDKNKEICELMAEALPGAIVICGDGAKEELLLEEGLSSMDAFVTLTGNDEENILISYLAKSRGVERVITKINREDFYVMAAKLGLDCTISPRKLVSAVLTRYARALQNSEGSKIETLYKLMDGKAEALEFVVGEDFPYCHVPLKDLKLKKNILIAGILRKRQTLIPTGADCILPEDRVVVLAAGQTLTDLADMME
ncbi:MAG: Trk system potassium transporter TrkA [Clostridia bacterium]|nr:Trk system potassium transporter TrkA [Clostridia bacterium]